MLKRILGCAAILLCVATLTSANVIFSDDFDDGAGQTRWSGPIVALENPLLGWDGTVDYAYDYSGVAGSAPNSAGTTIGVAFTSNNTNSVGDEGEAVGIIPMASLADIPSTDYRITFDAFIHWNGESGSTEYLSFGTHLTEARVPLRFGLDQGSGVSWQIDGDGDSATDLLRYENPPPLETGLGGWEDIPFGTIPANSQGDGFNTGVPGIDFPANQFSGPANTWIEVTLESIGGMISFQVNGAEIDSFDNTGGQFANGTLMIGHSDPFNSVNPPNAAGFTNIAVFDNVVLEQIPEPTGFALLSMAFLGLGALRRR